MNLDITKIMRLLEFTDSTFPVGTFSFSNGLETAVHEKIVYDAKTLEEYVRAIATQAAFSDAIVALKTLEAVNNNDYEDILNADNQVILFKMNSEARLMTQRMGKKMAELSVHIFESPIMSRWLDDIKSDKTPGTYPVAQAITFGFCGLSSRELFSAHQYGVINMVLSAALRSVRVSHYDTQRILFKLTEETAKIYDEVKVLDYDDMNVFVPMADIMASLHEKGTMRMFMN